ncbi:hypothetical protein [Bosea robiniae]|uniref:Integrase n=1 Tax=Bosea robiniae TaxID=1036780 RepID=A0ABY0NGP8_9HYPH|nr:hypothetical protein [Bosea robiniae]SDF36902.1 hypothetical protein SAMN05421844_101447 [Bosea robiniae]
MTQPKYLTPDGYEAVATYIGQAADRGPDHRLDESLLLKQPVHGPITHVELAMIDERPQVAVSIHGRNLRYFDPLDFCAVTLATAFGMGLSCNDTGKGWTYPRCRVAEPKSRAIHLLRILTDAQPWEVAKQHPAEGPRPDYHHLSRRGLSKQSVREAAWKLGKPSRVPRLGRKDFYDAVEWYWQRNHLKAGIPVSLPEHLSLIRTALEFGDQFGSREAASY